MSSRAVQERRALEKNGVGFESSWSRRFLWGYYKMASEAIGSIYLPGDARRRRVVM